MLSSADEVFSVVMSADVFQITRIQIEKPKFRNETLPKSGSEEQQKSLRQQARRGYANRFASSHGV